MQFLEVSAVLKDLAVFSAARSLSWTEQPLHRPDGDLAKTKSLITLLHLSKAPDDFLMYKNLRTYISAIEKSALWMEDSIIFCCYF